MKRLLIPLLVLFSFHAQAQWSAGIRSGIGFWGVKSYDENSFRYETINQSLWQNQTYVRYELFQELALEAGLGVISSESKGEYYGLCGTGLPSEYDFISGVNYHEKVYTLDLRAMLRPAFMRWGRLNNELGIVIAPGIAKTETIENVMEVRVDGTNNREQSTFDTRSCFQLGCEDHLRYLIGNHVEALVVGGFRVQNGARFLNNGLYAQIGLGYRF